MAKNKKKTGFDALSIEQKRKLFFKKCETKEEISKFIQVFFGLYLPDQTVSRFADTNPLDIIWEVYDICVNKNNPEDIEELLYVAGRGSGKCSEKGTLILTSSGPKAIENVRVGDVVFTGWNWQEVKQWFDEGIKDGLEIKTKLLSKETPNSICGSYKHRIQAIKEDGSVGWEYLPNISVGQYVYKASFDDNISFDVTDKEDGWLIGVLLGDGSISRHGNNVDFCSEDVECLRYYANLVYEKTGQKLKAKRNSKKSIVLSIASSDFRSWINQYIDGKLCYDKKLKTLEHSHGFLAGVISGLLDTDGYKDGITLANKDLIYQIGKILNNFGVICAIDNNRRMPRYSKFIKEEVTYHECIFKSKLHNFLLPNFSKRSSFIEHRDSMNEQFRYPNIIVEPFARFIKDELKASNGWLTVNGDRIRKSVPHAKALYSNRKKNQDYIYRHKLEDLQLFFKELHIQDKVDELQFILDGYFEEVSEVIPRQAYFYDLEIDETHSYWSNGFISHNTLGMAIAELLVMLHDGRDTCHVGAVLAQAKRCYEYQTKFMLSKRIRPIIDDKNIPQEDRVLQKLNMEKSAFNIDDTTVTLEVLPCTLKACLTYDSPVNQYIDGHWKRNIIGQLKVGDSIESPQGHIEVLDTKIKEEECLRIEFEDGTYIEGTLDHKIWTDKGWVELQHLTEDHKVLRHEDV